MNEPKVVSMYLGRRLSRLNLAEIGTAFGSPKYSTVGSVIMRVEKKMAHDRQLREKVHSLQIKLQKY